MSLGRIGKYIVSATEISGLPVLSFAGRIKLVDLSSTSSCNGEIGQKIRELLGLDFLDKRPVIGFDTESKPKALYSRKRNRTALIQLSSEDVCVMFRTASQTSLPSYLSDILNDERIIKIGQGIELDSRDLSDDFGRTINLKSCVDLFKIATHLQCQPKSLQGLVAMFLNQRLLKDMRISDWEAETLRAEQVQYAAIDAWAARSVYLRMLECGIDADSIGKVTMPSPCQVVETFPIPKSNESIPKKIFKSAQTELVNYCVENRYLLKLCGFDKVSSNKFKCKFEVSSHEQIFSAESSCGHTSIREAQEDAAKVMLDLLPPRFRSI